MRTAKVAARREVDAPLRRRRKHREIDDVRRQQELDREDIERGGEGRLSTDHTIQEEADISTHAKPIDGAAARGNRPSRGGDVRAEGAHREGAGIGADEIRGFAVEREEGDGIARAVSDDQLQVRWRECGAGAGHADEYC